MNLKKKVKLNRVYDEIHGFNDLIKSYSYHLLSKTNWDERHYSMW